MTRYFPKLGTIIIQKQTALIEFKTLDHKDTRNILEDYRVDDLTISMVPLGVVPKVPRTNKLHIHFLGKPSPGDIILIKTLNHNVTWSNP